MKAPAESTASTASAAPGMPARSRNDLPPMRPRRPRTAPGFTLVELLVVIVILAIGAAVAVLALPDAEAGALAQAAERSAALLRLAREEAILGGEPLAVVVAAGGYHVERRRDGRWRAVAGDPPFAARRWPPAAARVSLAIDGRDAVAGGRIVFDSDGYHPDFSLDFHGERLRVRVRGTPVDGIAMVGG